MHLTSILVVSTTFLAAQVPAYFIPAIEPNLPSWNVASPALASSMTAPSPSSSSIASANEIPSTPSHYMANRPFRPMHGPKISQGSSTLRPVTRPSAYTADDQDQNQDFRQPSAESAQDPYAVPGGGIAPVDPLQPGSDVAPVLIQKPSGVDEGNSFCIGQCYDNKRDAHCSKPYASRMYKSAYGCWMCCFTAPDF